MLYDVLYYIVMVLEIVFMYIALLMIEKYIFLEPQMEPEKQKKFYAITVPVLIIGSLFSELVGQGIMVLSVLLNVILGRKKRKALGCLTVIWAMGILNGVCGPIIVTPTILTEMSQTSVIIYRLIVYAIIYTGMILFYLYGKNWRNKYNADMQQRHLYKWEYALLMGVGAMMMVYAYSVMAVPHMIDTSYLDSIDAVNREEVSFIIEYTNVLAKDMTKVFGFMAVISFVLSITVIILVIQGNKRSYYQKKALDSQIAEKERVERMSLQMVRTLANTIDAKDSYTNGHSTRVAKYSVMIAKKMGYEGEKLELLEYSALLHDIGKIGIPNEIINKPSRLTDEEYEVIKTHPGIGGKILQEISEIPDIAIGAYYHHERFDGRGYPDKLVGMDIPEIARIIGVADAYDAMTSNRSYRDLLPQEVVRGEIEKGKGTQFDPDIADVMLQLIDEDTEYTMHE